MTEFTNERPGSNRFKVAALQVVRETGDLFSSVAESTAGFVKEAGHEALEAGDVLVDIIAGVIGAVVSIGHDAVEAARGIALGVLRGKKAEPGSAFTTLAVSSRSVIRQVGRAGGDIAAATRGLVAGAAEGARELGMDVSEAVFAVSRGALQGAREFGYAAGEEVREAVAAMREIVRGREPGRSHFEEMEDTPMFFPGPMVE
ncbi:MAG: hypothetical protein FD180_987 [Planctomycetota bacterium]|nr:MAG: hypothetical protein FD180_987 [Planctomycetota bacterium]